MSAQNPAAETPEVRKSRREAIMDAAMAVLGTSGLDRASVEDIARSAGIGKGTIYLYFKSKEEIFDGILGERWPGPYLERLMPEILSSEEVMNAPLEVVFERIGNGFLAAVEENMLVLRLALSDAYRFPDRAEHLFESTFLKANRILAAFLEAQQKAGRIGPLESPLITARCYQGMLMTYVLSQEMLGGKKYTLIEREEWVRVAVRILLQGIQGRGPEQTPAEPERG